MELETINKLYLELSQFATAKTARETELENKLKSVDSLPEPALREVSREKAVVIKLANWSLKNPIEPNLELNDSAKEILEIEKEAKELLEEYNKETSKNS